MQWFAGPVAGLGITPAELMLLFGAAVIVLGRWLPSYLRRPAVLAASVLFAFSAIVLLATGLRWQMIPVLVAPAIVLLYEIFRTRMAPGQLLQGRSGWLAVLVSLCGFGLVAGGAGLGWALPLPAFPEPSGPYKVGAAVFQWTDPERLEPFTDAPDDHRTIVVQLWYPAENVAQPHQGAIRGNRTLEEAQAVDNATWDAFGIPRFVLAPVADIRTHAVFDAPVAAGDERFPFVVFSPGLTGTRTANTALVEEWASRGYVVASIDHTYDAALTLIDGQPILSRNHATGDEDLGRQETIRNIDMRVADLSFVLTQLEKIDSGELPGPLAGRIDTDRAATAGHSRGGAAAMMATSDPRFKAAINIDGGLGDYPPHAFDQPVLAINNAHDAVSVEDYIPNLERALTLGSNTSYRVVMHGLGHISFTDAGLFFPPVPSLIGTRNRAENLRRTGELTGIFLDATLRGTGATGLHDRLAQFGDVTVYD